MTCILVEFCHLGVIMNLEMCYVICYNNREIKPHFSGKIKEEGFCQQKEIRFTKSQKKKKAEIELRCGSE